MPKVDKDIEKLIKENPKLAEYIDKIRKEQFYEEDRIIDYTEDNKPKCYAIHTRVNGKIYSL